MKNGSKESVYAKGDDDFLEMSHLTWCWCQKQTVFKALYICKIVKYQVFFSVW